MKYILNKKSTNNFNSVNLKNELLKVKGISNIDAYCNPNKTHEIDYNKLKNIDIGLKCLLKHIENNDLIEVLVDEDTDGFTSSAILINYLRRSFPKIKISYILHTKRKAHGLSKDVIISKNTKLLIIPDAGSNDYLKHKELKDKGIDIILLDHHEAEYESKEAIVINNQLCDYPNKSLSGVGIVYKFLQALDDELWLNYADDYLDMVAIGLIGDNMDMKNLETRYYTDKGLKQIKNKQIKALIKKQEYSTKGILNMTTIAFYIVPLINGMIRIGKQDEKELMFRGFLEEYIEFDYKPRGKEDFIRETIYNRVARLSSNTKQRQDKIRNKAFEDIIKIIEETNKNKDKIIVVNCTDIVDVSLTGVVAIKVAGKYNKPCLLLRKEKDKESCYGGSGRNTNKNELNDFKQFLQDSSLFKFAEGHKSAFGVSITKENISKFIEYANDSLKNVEFDGNRYEVDFIIPFEDLQDEIIYQIDLLKDLWSKGVEEPLIAIENIEVSSNDVELIGKTSNTLKFVVDGVEFIKFFISPNEPLISNTCDWNDNNKIFSVNLVGKCSKNTYNGEVKPQIIIEDYECIIVKEE